MTDTPSAPMGGAGTTGDENGLGGYLSVYGFNFGSQSGLGTVLGTQVFVGGQQVGNYRALVTAKVSTAGMPIARTMQHIAVQVGALGSLVNGTAYPVTVVVGGTLVSNADLTFTPNPGPINWIDTVNGSDSGSHSGITQPWKTPQTVDGSGNINGGLFTSSSQTPGCQNIFRSGTYQTTGKDGMLFRFFRMGGSLATGVSGSGGIHNTPYPGPILGNAIESVTLYRPSGAASCIGGNDSARGNESSPSGTGWAYGITISNFVMWHDPGSIDGPINNGSNSNAWRICNCELGPWLANVNGKAAGVAGDGSDVIVFANYIHDIQSPTTENHGIYLDGSNTGAGGTIGWAAQRWDISWNYIKNMLGGSGFQQYGNAAPAGTYFNGTRFHHNVIDTTAKYGVNIADGSQSALVYDNLIMNTGSYALRTNCTGVQMSISFLFNTCYNPMTASSGGSNAFYANEWNLTTAGSYVELIGNIFIMGASRANNSLAWTGNGGSDTVGAIQASGNLGFDPQGHTTSFPGNLYGDPKVTTQWTNFQLLAGSPAINAGSQSAHFAVTTDMNYNPRPKPGNTKPTIGCFEAP